MTASNFKEDILKVVGEVIEEESKKAGLKILVRAESTEELRDD